MNGVRIKIITLKTFHSVPVNINSTSTFLVKNSILKCKNVNKLWLPIKN